MIPGSAAGVILHTASGLLVAMMTLAAIDGGVTVINWYSSRYAKTESIRSSVRRGRA